MSDRTVTAKLAEWEALVEETTGDYSLAYHTGTHEWAIRTDDKPTVLLMHKSLDIVPALLGFVRVVQKLHHLIKDSSLTSLDVDPFWRCSCGALDCPTEQAARKWIGE